MGDDDITGVLRTELVRVLFLHDPAYELDALYQSLRKDYLVRTATSVVEAREASLSEPYACLVCVAGGAIRARAAFETVGVGGYADRLVFLRSVESNDDDDVFFVTSGRPWLAASTKPSELLAAVRAVAQKGWSSPAA